MEQFLPAEIALVCEVRKLCRRQSKALRDISFRLEWQPTWQPYASLERHCQHYLATLI
jgi:hypothetical protein